MSKCSKCPRYKDQLNSIKQEVELQKAHIDECWVEQNRLNGIIESQNCIHQTKVEELHAQIVYLKERISEIELDQAQAKIQQTFANKETQVSCQTLSFASQTRYDSQLIAQVKCQEQLRFQFGIFSLEIYPCKYKAVSAKDLAENSACRLRTSASASDLCQNKPLDLLDSQSPEKAKSVNNKFNTRNDTESNCIYTLAKETDLVMLECQTDDQPCSTQQDLICYSERLSALNGNTIYSQFLTQEHETKSSFPSGQIDKDLTVKVYDIPNILIEAKSDCVTVQSFVENDYYHVWFHKNDGFLFIQLTNLERLKPKQAKDWTINKDFYIKSQQQQTVAGFDCENLLWNNFDTQISQIANQSSQSVSLQSLDLPMFQIQTHHARYFYTMVLVLSAYFWYTGSFLGIYFQAALGYLLILIRKQKIASYQAAHVFICSSFFLSSMQLQLEIQFKDTVGFIVALVYTWANTFELTINGKGRFPYLLIIWFAVLFSFNLFILSFSIQERRSYSAKKLFACVSPFYKQILWLLFAHGLINRFKVADQFDDLPFGMPAVQQNQVPQMHGNSKVPSDASTNESYVDPLNPRKELLLSELFVISALSFEFVSKECMPESLEDLIPRLILCVFFQLGTVTIFVAYDSIGRLFCRAHPKENFLRKFAR